MATLNTSNVFAFVDTNYSLIYDALSKLGYVTDEDPDSPTPEEFALCQRNLNRLLKNLQADDNLGGSIKMWQIQQGYMFLSSNTHPTGQYQLQANNGLWCNANGFVIALSAGNNAPSAQTINVAFSTNSNNALKSANNFWIGTTDDTGNIEWRYTSNVVAKPTQWAINLSSSMTFSCNGTSNPVYIVTDASAQPPQNILNIVLRDSGGNDIPVRSDLTLEEYRNLASKQNPNFTGDPIAVYYQPYLIGQNPYGTVYTDVAQAQDTTKYLVIDYIREIQDLVNPNDVVEIPKEWSRVIVLELAREVSPDFECDWTQTLEAMRLASIERATKNNKKKSKKHFMPGNRGGQWNMGDGFYSR